MEDAWLVDLVTVDTDVNLTMAYPEIARPAVACRAASSESAAA